MDHPAEKLCSTCGEIKPLGDFYRKTGAKDGRMARCKVCQGIANRKANALRYKRNTAALIQYQRDYHADPAGRCKQALRSARYNAERQGHSPCTAGLAEVMAALTRQRGCCALCGRHESELTKRLALDHCHSTGKFRGWLCDRCNRTFLPVVETDPGIAERVVSYLRAA